MTIEVSAPTVQTGSQTGTPSVALLTLNDFQQAVYKTDLANTFFNAGEFAIEINYYHSSLDTWQAYDVLYDDPQASVNLAGPANFNTTRPQFQIQESALRHRILKEDRCLVKGKYYSVEDFISDGVGVTTVYLRAR